MDYLGQDRREGLGRKANSRVVLVILILASVFLLLSSLYSAQASVFKKARESVLDATSPILEILSGPIAYVNGVIGYVGDYFAVLEQNDALRQENAELRQWMNEALELRTVVSGFEGLQSYQAPPQLRPVDAYIIGESNDAFSRSMIINAGRRKNVEARQAVVDPDGLLGRVIHIGANASRVLLLTDVQSRVPVYVEGADVEGILVGRSRARPAISIIETSEDVEILPGQRVLTSGAEGVLPRGLPVGEVEGAGDDLEVDLYANYTRTRMVRVINFDFPAVAEPIVDDEPEAGADAPDDETQAEG